MIKVKYSSIDRFSKSAQFKTLAGAQKFAQKWVGASPELGSYYAVSADGVGKVTVRGDLDGKAVTVADLFAKQEADVPEDSYDEDAYYDIYQNC
jgi:hypothetical protein